MGYTIEEHVQARVRRLDTWSKRKKGTTIRVGLKPWSPFYGRHSISLIDVEIMERSHDIPGLLTALEDADWYNRSVAAGILGRIEDEQVIGVPTTIKQAGDFGCTS